MGYATVNMESDATATMSHAVNLDLFLEENDMYQKREKKRRSGIIVGGWFQ
jgi:hypothetical protein